MSLSNQTENSVLKALLQGTDLPFRAGAQQYLAHFYGALGFVAVTAPYDEDGIPHLEMLRAAPAA